MALIGPSGSGKTDLIFKMLLHKTFYPLLDEIYYFYREDQPIFRDMTTKLNIQFIKFNSFSMAHARKSSMIRNLLRSQLLEDTENYM